MPRFPLLMLLVFALTLFCSATILFMLELMIGKMILPILGGTPAVWNTCMVFYQLVLLLGYLYAHVSTTWLGARKQAALHLLLLALPFLSLPLAVKSNLIKGDEHPILAVLLLLTMSIGLPMFVISSTAPLLQKWFASTAHPAAKDPYFLYGASNLGSMIGLLAYPVVVEPYLRLGQQSIDLSIGFGVLVALTVLCAAFLWSWPPPVETSAKTALEGAEAFHKSHESIQVKQQSIRGGKRPPAAADDHTLTGEVTWRRILRWVALAAVPSSMMLGTTTYITTDIASMPFLWVLPLALYLLSFIIVFSRVPGWVHKVMVVVMPLFLLFSLFFLLSEVKPRGENWFASHWITLSVSFHLLTLFVVSMVCHGELARDRPAAKHLTSYFLWMSVGGVLGGLFNGLLAPLIFTGIVEYELAMMLACYLAPPLGDTGDSSESSRGPSPEIIHDDPMREMRRMVKSGSTWGRRYDVILAVLLASIGLLLMVFRLREKDLPFDLLAHAPWPWLLALLLGGIALGLAAVRRAQSNRFDHWLDLLLPLSLGLMLVGLSWGLPSDIVARRLQALTTAMHLNIQNIIVSLTFGLPLVMCYTFVERSLRFALGIGAILLASGFCGIFTNKLIHQERSFFGVLKIERELYNFQEAVYNPDKQKYEPTRKLQFTLRHLMHGTTLHGIQCIDPQERRDEPLTYYHHTGPIGEIMMAYNGPDVPPQRLNMAVVGLGTGTMACYARKGQRLTFYDIDAVVRRLSFDDDAQGNPPYFTFVHDAKKRGADVKIVMGDARLTMERQQLSNDEKYGVILVDAFSSDAIPVHLITREAVNIFLDKMTEDGLLVYHISNRHLDLKPVLYNLVQDRGLAAVFQSDDFEKDPDSTGLLSKTSSTWVVLARKSAYLDKLRELNDWEDQRKELRFGLLPLMLWPDGGAGLVTQSMLVRNFLDESTCRRAGLWHELEPTERWPNLQKVGVWTDDYSNLLSVFWW